MRNNSPLQMIGVSAMRHVLHTVLLVMVVTVTLLTFNGCAGGGTDGTGLPKNLVTGTVKDVNGNRLANVRVTETGVSSTTDAAGQFTLQSEAFDGTLDFSIEQGSVSAATTLPIPSTSRNVEVEITFDRNRSSAESRLIDFSEIQALDLSAQVIGACADSFFVDQGSISQVKFLENGTNCLLRVRANDEHGDALGGMKVAIQRRPCRDSAPWTTTEVRLTSTRTRAGEAILPFRFFNTERGCEYRVVAPYGQNSPVNDVVQIVTTQSLSK